MAEIAVLNGSYLQKKRSRASTLDTLARHSDVMGRQCGVTKSKSNSQNCDSYLPTMSLHNSFLIILILSLLAFNQAFSPSRVNTCRVNSNTRNLNYRSFSIDPVAYTNQLSRRNCQLFGGFFDEIGSFMKRFTTKATASHILIKGGAEAENKLADLKAEIGDSPVMFAEAAAKYSECPSASSGGSLGEFGPGAMVKEFDQVVFNEKVGVVHGPVETQFGYHLIYISERME
jgi:peptidyl-prolyl cis-trans isomerase C